MARVEAAEGAVAQPVAQRFVVGSVGAVGEVEGHVLKHAQALQRRPAVGAVAQQAKLQRQVLRHVEPVEVGVDAGGVGAQQLKLLPPFPPDAAQVLLRALLHARLPQKAIGFYRRGTKGFGEAAGGHARDEVELEEAVAGDDVAERGGGVGVALGEDVRHAARVANDGDGRLERLWNPQPGALGVGGASGGAVKPVGGIEERAQRRQARKARPQRPQQRGGQQQREHRRAVASEHGGSCDA
jgi:hypothetical protein